MEHTVWDPWSKLARPVSRTNREPLSKRSRSASGLLSPLESLPTELIAMILACAELPKNDIVSVGITSETLWLHAIGHIDRSYMRSLVAPWAGAELACTASLATDLPPSFAEDDLTLNAIGVRVEDVGEMGSAMILAQTTFERFTYPEKDVEQEWRKAFDSHATNRAHVSKTRIAQMSQELLAVS